MSDADDRFVERLADKLAPLLGPRLRVTAIDLERPTGDRVRIVVTVETSAKPRLMIEEGDSLTDVTSRLLAKAAGSPTRRGDARDHGWRAGLMEPVGVTGSRPGPGGCRRDPETRE